MSERQTNQRPATPEVVDLTNDIYTSPTRSAAAISRRKPSHRSNNARNTYIDLTATPSQPQTPVESVASTSNSFASNGTLATDVEVLYEFRRTTPQPPARMGRQQHSVPITTRAQSRDVEVVTDDDDLPNVRIPSKKQKGSEASSNKEDETPSLFCPICLETYAKLQTQDVNAVVVSSCSHVFCKKCIEEALKTAKSCPKCRRVLRGKTPFKALFF